MDIFTEGEMTTMKGVGSRQEKDASKTMDLDNIGVKAEDVQDRISWRRRV